MSAGREVAAALLTLLDGIAGINVQRQPLAGPIDLLLIVDAEQVHLTGPGTEMSASHGGVRSGLAEAVNEVRRERPEPLAVRAEPGPQVPPAGRPGSPGRAARLLAESFLSEPVTPVS